MSARELRREVFMRRSLLLSGAVLILAVVIELSGKLRPERATAQPPAPATATCTFTNPGYSGKCVENVPTQGGTASAACRDVLACLNGPNCTKTYCQATTIRTNWKLESAVPAK
jgi:hypothetical protein